MEIKWILVWFGLPLYSALTIQDTTIQEMSVQDIEILESPISDTGIRNAISIETPNLDTPSNETHEEEFVMTISQDAMNYCMNKHNEVRAHHQSPDFQLDQKLCSSAQKWADHLASTNDFKHSGTRGVGENLAATSSSDQTKVMGEAVDMWYEEGQQYRYGNDFQPECGHFTQCVWASSTSLGCGVAWDDYNQWNIVVCQYYPPGNVQGEYQDNVKRPSYKQYFTNVTQSLTVESEE